jgi:IclR family acetate operon transcriptional repressor
MPQSRVKPEAANSKKTDQVQSVTRALRLLELLAEKVEGRRLTDLSARSGLSPSTAHRLLTTMQQQGFVQFDSSRGLWLIGKQCFTVGAAFAHRQALVAPAMPILRHLRDQTRETINLGMVDGGQIVIMARVESREIVQAITRVGGCVGMEASGLGKAVLATYAEQDLQKLLGRTRPLALKQGARSPFVALKDELRAIQKRGFAVDNEEFSIGVKCVAAAVFNERAEAIGAISASGAASRIPDHRVENIGSLVAQAAAQVTAALGGVVPSGQQSV